MVSTVRRMGGFLWLVIPGAIVAVVLIFFPLASAISLSFYELETIASTPQFVGFANYVRVLQDATFWNAFVNGLVYAGAAIFFQVALGIVFGVILNESFRGVRLLRGSVIFPYVVPTVVGVMVWRWMLEENNGIITKFVESLGFHIGWFSTPNWAMFSVVLISVWFWTPFVTVSVLAGLQTISPELYDAAHVDGAGALQRFWHVTLPGLVPVLVVVALLRGIWMFNKFDVIWLTTGGGPLHSTEHLPIMAYQMAFGSFDLGGGSAVATLNLVFLVMVVVIYLRLTRAWSIR